MKANSSYPEQYTYTSSRGLHLNRIHGYDAQLNSVFVGMSNYSKCWIVVLMTSSGLEQREGSHSRPGPSLTRGPDVSLSGESVESLCEVALEKALSLGSVSAMSDRLSISSSGCVKIQSSARSRLLFWNSPNNTVHEINLITSQMIIFLSCTWKRCNRGWGLLSLLPYDG